MLNFARTLRRFHLLLLLVTVITILIIINTINRNKPTESILVHPYYHFDFRVEEPRLDVSQFCLIPKIHPFDPSIWRYLSDPLPISCKILIPTLTYIDESGWLRINSTALLESGYHLDDEGFVGTLTCYWKPVLRGGPDQTDDDNIKYGEEQTLTLDGTSVANHEVLVASCRNFAGVSVYRNVHAHIRNEMIRQRLSRPKDKPGNVFIFGLDSLSRQSFIRLLPKTYRYLTRTLGMRIFGGMNKIADDTYPNLVAVLTGDKAYGSSMSEIPDFDDWPLLWRDFSDAGYTTMWAEDHPDFGLFNYLAKGFKRPPVHHYLRPFWLAVKNCASLRTSSHLCYGNVPKHQLQLDYVLRFIKKFDTHHPIPYFGFSFLVELSSDYLSRIAVADEDFERFFKTINDGHYLDNALMVVMSDHGQRLDTIRSSQVGRLEERLPFFAMHIPHRAITENKHSLYNLDVNRGRLTTPFDVHATLMDYLRWSTMKAHPLGGGIMTTGQRYGKTLFGSIPSNRSCQDAGIPPDCCVCEPETAVATGDLRVRAAVKVLFFRINKLLKTVKDFCVELNPGTVFNAHVISLDGSGQDRIRLTVSAQPSDAIFEAMVEVKARGASRSFGSLPYESRVLGDINRVNKIGNQSNCIRHEVLRRYCFCQKLTSSLSHLRSYQEQTRVRGL